MTNNTEVARILMNILIYSVFELVKIYFLVRILNLVKKLKN